MERSEISKCLKCGQGVLHSRHRTFFKVELFYELANVRNIQRMDAMDQMLGSLGRVFMDTETVSDTVSTVKGLICFSCATETPIYDLYSGNITNDAART